MALDDNNILLRLPTSPYCKTVPVFIESSITFFSKISLKQQQHLSILEGGPALAVLLRNCNLSILPQSPAV